MLIVPTKPLVAQTFTMQLAEQRCRLTVYERFEYLPEKVPALFLDLLVNDKPVLVGQICRDRVRLVRDEYLGFIGDLGFFDSQGTADPLSAGLGSRWHLVYLEAGE